MKIKTKLFIILLLLITSILITVCLSLWAFNRMTVLNRATTDGQEFIISMKDVNILLNDLLYTPNLLNTSSKFDSIVKKYYTAYDQFFNSPMSQSFSEDEELQYNFKTLKAIYKRELEKVF